MTTVKQHYVSQFYLKKFSVSSNHLIDAFLKPQNKFINTNAKNICYRKYFYDPDDVTKFNKWIIEQASRYNLSIPNERLAHGQYIESEFLTALEKTTSNCLNKILESSNGIILQDDRFRVCIMMFFVNLHARSPYLRDKYESFFDQRREAYKKFPQHIQDEFNHVLEKSPKEQQISEIIDMRYYFDDTIQRSKYEWSLAVLNEDNTFFIGDNFTYLYNLKELCIPISLDKAILIRSKNPNQRKWYPEKTNKKYLTKLNERSYFICSTFQDANSEALVGDKDSISKYMNIQNGLKFNFK